VFFDTSCFFFATCTTQLACPSCFLRDPPTFGARIGRRHRRHDDPCHPGRGDRHGAPAARRVREPHGAGGDNARLSAARHAGDPPVRCDAQIRLGDGDRRSLSLEVRESFDAIVAVVAFSHISTLLCVFFFFLLTFETANFFLKNDSTEKTLSRQQSRRKSLWTNC
jgi:hypothetical protein